MMLTLIGRDGYVTRQAPLTELQAAAAARDWNRLCSFFAEFGRLRKPTCAHRARLQCTHQLKRTSN